MRAFSPSFLPTLFLLFHLLDRFVTFMFSFLFHLDLIRFDHLCVHVSFFSFCLCGMFSPWSFPLTKAEMININDLYPCEIDWCQKTADISGILVAMATKSQ